MILSSLTTHRRYVVPSLSYVELLVQSAITVGEGEHATYQLITKVDITVGPADMLAV